MKCEDKYVKWVYEVLNKKIMIKKSMQDIIIHNNKQQKVLMSA